MCEDENKENKVNNKFAAQIIIVRKTSESKEYLQKSRTNS